MAYRPHRNGPCHCIYLYGCTGTGKTELVKRCLNLLRTYYATEYYCKPSGCSKSFDDGF